MGEVEPRSYLGVFLLGLSAGVIANAIFWIVSFLV